VDVNTLSILIALAGCFVGLAGWLSGRDKQVSGDAEWRGMVNAKLDVLVGVRSDILDLKKEAQEHGRQITAVQESAKQAHRRIDRLEHKED
jgi:hypothetical protein